MREKLKEKQKKYRHRQGQLVRELGEHLPVTLPGAVRSLNQTLQGASAPPKVVFHQRKARFIPIRKIWATIKTT
jgi:hypothetical protein